jgi:hypothetical protein
LAILVVGGTATIALPPETLIAGGLGAIALGTLVGVPAGIYYHVLLRRLLVQQGALPERWWLHPVRLHDVLTAKQRSIFMPWFYVGGAGFMLIIAASISVALGLLRYE